MAKGTEDDAESLLSFPPFYTLQVNDALRDKQLNEWKAVILSWHQKRSQPIMDVAAFPLWENKEIGRKLSESGIRSVMEFLVSSGSAEWEDGSRARARVFFRSPEEWAARLYDFAARSAVFGNVYTVYELRARDIAVEEPFHGLDAGTIASALRVLEREGKAFLEPGDTTDQMGVQFIEK